MSDQAWKFLDEKNGQIVSGHGDMTWTIGTWEHQDGQIRACRCDFHCSALISQAFSYVQGSVLARVEVRGQKDSDRSDKAAYSDMRITEAYRWTLNDSVALAVFAAELVIEIFESNRPGDDRPRKAIEAAKKYLEAPENSDAAARAAYAAARAARAAYAAADAARAAYAAADAAYAAADAAFSDKIEEWLVGRVSELKKFVQ